MSWRISRALLASLADEADAAHPLEICGLLLGDRAGRTIVEAVAVPNSAADPTAAFAIDPARQLAIQREARARGLRVVGHYHSHPSGIARPSAADRDQMGDEGRLWLILAGGETGLWAEHRGDFVSVTIDRTDPPPCKAGRERPIGQAS